MPPFRPLRAIRPVLIPATLIALIAATAFGAAPPAPAAEGSGAEALCPPLDDPPTGVNLNGMSVTAPASPRERDAAFVQLAMGDGPERQRAIVSLALGGDLHAFHDLLDEGDAGGLSLYAGNYVNAAGSSCVDEEIERAVLARLDDATLRRTLLTFFFGNLYRSPDTFEHLIALRLDPGHPHRFEPVVMALVSTRLEGVEARILEQAEANLPHTTPALKSALPGIHRHYVRFLAGRSHVPAIDYMTRLLAVEGYDETVESLIARYSQTRSTIYRALDLFASSLVADVFVAQLQKLTGLHDARLIRYEIHAMGQYAVRHATTDERKKQVVAHLSRLLSSETDYRAYSKISELMAATAHTCAADALLKELERLETIRNEPGVESYVVRTLQSLAALPPAAGLDVPRFVALASKMPDRDRLQRVPQVLDAHSHPAAHAFYLEQLRWIEATRGDSRVGGADAAWRMLQRLVSFEEPALMRLTREELDRLVVEGMIDEKSFLDTSSRINQRLGDESPVYREVLERRRRAVTAARERSQENRLGEWRRRHLDTLVERTTPAGIRLGIEALAGSGSRAGEAFVWLQIAGAEALPALHLALADPAAEERLRFQLLRVLGEIGDERSVEPILSFVRAEPAFVRDAFLALSRMPPTEASFRFADEMLDGPVTERARESALVYLALIADPRSGNRADRFAVPQTAPRLRAAALLLAARTGDPEIRPRIVEALRTAEDRSVGEVLSRALAEISTPDRFRAEIVEKTAGPERPYHRVALRLTRFRHADGEEKDLLAREMIESGHPWDRAEAIRYLVARRRHAVLAELLRTDPGLALPVEMAGLGSPAAQQVLNEARRLGLQFLETPAGPRLTIGPLPQTRQR